MKTFLSLLLVLVGLAARGADYTFAIRIVGDGSGLTNLSAGTTQQVVATFGNVTVTNTITANTFNVTTLNTANINLTNALGSNQVRLGMAQLTNVSFASLADRQTIAYNAAAGTFTNVLGRLFTQTNTVTVTNVTVSTALLGGVGSTNIGANTLAVGNTIRITVYGVYSTDAAPGGTTLTMRVLLNGSVACQTPVDAPPSGHNAQAWRLNFEAVVRKVGASGLVMPGGMMTYGRGVATSSDVQGMPSAATLAVDTTAAITISVDASLNNTTDAIGISCQGGTIEIIP